MKEMTDFSIDEWERIAARKELERENDLKEIDRLDNLAKLPFHLRIQQKGEEKMLKKVEEHQKECFLGYYTKKWGINKDDVLELFQEYFTEFLNGKIKNIREFLFSRGYKYAE